MPLQRPVGAHALEVEVDAGKAEQPKKSSGPHRSAGRRSTRGASRRTIARTRRRRLGRARAVRDLRRAAWAHRPGAGGAARAASDLQRRRPYVYDPPLLFILTLLLSSSLAISRRTLSTDTPELHCPHGRRPERMWDSRARMLVRACAPRAYLYESPCVSSLSKSQTKRVATR